MKDSLHPPESKNEAPFEEPRKGTHPITTELRILATTDIHMQLLGFDYAQDRSVGHSGLAGLASLIKSARLEAALDQKPCLVVDNGDMLQGSALGDALAHTRVTPKHPIVASLNEMAYDVVGIGNHDLDHGLTYLQRIAGLSAAPFISSNLIIDRDSAILGSTIITCSCDGMENAGQDALNIGFVSILPTQTNIWNKPMLDGQARVIPPQEALSKVIPQLRAQGADIVILLAHMGIEDSTNDDDARALAKLPGVDAMVTGHTHRRLPGIDHAGLNNVDTRNGAVGPCPAAMPGFNASDLAVLDLKLSRGMDGSWQVKDYIVQLRANTADVPPDPAITAICQPAHTKTRNSLAEAIGQSPHPLHNFFSLAMPTPTCALAASSKRWVVQTGLRGTPEAKLPLLAASSAHTAGGRGGPDHFIDVACGTVYRRSLAGLSPYTNTICALRITGAELRAWLERSAGIYTQLDPTQPNQPLLCDNRATFHFDTIYGLRYGIDPTRDAGERITRLSYNGSPVRDNQPFILATNKYRAAGGGGGEKFGQDQVAFNSEITELDALLATLNRNIMAYTAQETPWHFDCALQVEAIIKTGPQALDHLGDIAHLSPEPMPTDPKGFRPIRLTL